MAERHIQEWQEIVGAEPDGDFGPKTLQRSKDKIGYKPPSLPDLPPEIYELTATSYARLDGVHADLRRLFVHVSKRYPIAIIEGLRSQERQRQLVASGASKTLNSRHLTGHAVDVAPLDNGVISWSWPLYEKLAPRIKQVAQALGIDVEWGGDWESFRDGPHWQIPWGAS